MVDLFPTVCFRCLYKALAHIGGFLAFLLFVAIFVIIVWEILRPKR